MLWSPVPAPPPLIERPGHEPATRARRRTLLLVAPLLLAFGLAARFGLSGAPADATGAIAYTAFAYLLLALAFPSAAPPRIGAAAFGFSAAVELFQLTGVPESLAGAFGPSRLVFGTSFAATDLVAYAAGALLSVAIDRAVARRPAVAPS